MVTQKGQHFRVECPGYSCRETCEVRLSERIPVRDIEADAWVEAEEAHGWSDQGYCPVCTKAHAQEVAADNAAYEAKLRREGLTA